MNFKGWKNFYDIVLDYFGGNIIFTSYNSKSVATLQSATRVRIHTTGGWLVMAESGSFEQAALGGTKIENQKIC